MFDGVQIPFVQSTMISRDNLLLTSLFNKENFMTQLFNLTIITCICLFQTLQTFKCANTIQKCLVRKVEHQSYVLHCRFMAYECLRVGAEDLRILVSSEMVRVFSVGASGMCTTVIETHLRYIITPFNITCRWWPSWTENSSMQISEVYFPIAQHSILTYVLMLLLLYGFIFVNSLLCRYRFCFP